MLEGKNDIVEWFTRTGCGYWTLYRYGKTSAEDQVLRSTGDDDTKPAVAQQELVQALNIHKGRYTLVAHKGSSRSPKQDFKEEIDTTTNTVGAAATPVMSGPPVGYLTKEEAKQMMISGIDEYKKELAVEQLRKEVAELKKANKELDKKANEPLTRIMTIVEPFLPGIFGAMQQKIAGIPAAHTYTPTNHEHETHETPVMQNNTLTPEDRLSAVIDILQHATPEWLDMLEKLAAKIQANPGMVNTLKAFL